jgi:hypothetical protein
MTVARAGHPAPGCAHGQAPGSLALSARWSTNRSKYSCSARKPKAAAGSFRIGNCASRIYARASVNSRSLPAGERPFHLQQRHARVRSQPCGGRPVTWLARLFFAASSSRSGSPVPSIFPNPQFSRTNMSQRLSAWSFTPPSRGRSPGFPSGRRRPPERLSQLDRRNRPRASPKRPIQRHSNRQEQHFAGDAGVRLPQPGGAPATASRCDSEQGGGHRMGPAGTGWIETAGHAHAQRSRRPGDLAERVA